MNVLITKFENEMNKPKEQPKVTSFYKYKLNDPYNFDHNIGFTPKYNLKVWDKPTSNYNDNKYNLKREDISYEMSYKSDNFTPDSYYQFDLEGMTNDKMRINNYQTELGQSTDLNRRIRNDDTGETLQEIAEEDNERITSFKTLLSEYNKNLVIATTQDDKDEVTNKYEEDKITQNRKYNKPTIMKIPENIKFNKNIEKLKKTAKKYDNLIHKKDTQTDFINEKFKDYKKTFYRETKANKNEVLNQMDSNNLNMNAEILEHKNNAKKIQKIGRNYIKKVQNQKIEQDKINKEYLSYIQPGKKNYDEDDTDKPIEISADNITKIDNLTNNEIIKQIYEICGQQKSNKKLTIEEKNSINKILTNNGKDPLTPTASNKEQIGLWLSNRQII